MHSIPPDPTLRAAVLALDRGEQPTGSGLRSAIQLGLAHMEDGEAMLTDEGCVRAREWRDDDDHGGNAA